MLHFASRSQLTEPTPTECFFLTDQRYQPDGVVAPLNDIGNTYSKFAYIFTDRVLFLGRTTGTAAGLAFISTDCGLLPPGTELPSDPHMLLARL